MEEIKYIINQIRKAQKKKYDCTIALSGFVGEGKSTLSIQLMKAYYNIETFEQFKKMIRENLIYSRKSLMDMAENKKKQFLNTDEAVSVLFKRDFMKGDQKDLLKTLDICRSNKNVFTFNVPSFWSLDAHAIQTRIRLWIMVEKQKYAHIFFPKRNPFSLDVWNRTYNEKVYNKTRGFTKSPNYITTIKFNALSKEEYKFYDEIKDLKKLEGVKEQEVETPTLTKKEALIWLWSNNPKLSNVELGKILKTNSVYVSRVLMEHKRLTSLTT